MDDPRTQTLVDSISPLTDVEAQELCSTLQTTFDLHGQTNPVSFFNRVCGSCSSLEDAQAFYTRAFRTLEDFTPMTDEKRTFRHMLNAMSSLLSVPPEVPLTKEMKLFNILLLRIKVDGLVRHRENMLALPPPSLHCVPGAWIFAPAASDVRAPFAICSLPSPTHAPHFHFGFHFDLSTSPV